MKCSNCGAEADDSLYRVCPYCKTKLENGLADATVGTAHQPSQIVINNGFQPMPMSAAVGMKIPKTPRPKLNVGVAVIGLFFYVIPGLIYIISVKSAQKKWDEKYTY
jgi:hypothetical protein